MKNFASCPTRRNNNSNPRNDNNARLTLLVYDVFLGSRILKSLVFFPSGQAWSDELKQGRKRGRTVTGEKSWSRTQFQNSRAPSNTNWIFAHGYSTVPRAITESSFVVPLEEDSKNLAASSSVSRLITRGTKNRRFLPVEDRYRKAYPSRSSVGHSMWTHN